MATECTAVDRAVERRHLLATAGTVAGGLLAGCSALSDPLSADWEMSVDGDGTATLESDGLEDAEIELRVNRCSTATAVASLGDVSGELRVAFDWETEADGWWERPFFAVRSDDETVLDNRDDDEVSIDIEERAERSGTVETTVAVEDETEVRFGIEPSDHCGNPDHGNTYFTISDLVIERA